jgi:hypothetical protein
MPHQKRPSALTTRGSTSALRIDGTVVETQSHHVTGICGCVTALPDCSPGPGVSIRVQTSGMPARTGSRRWCGPSPEGFCTVN